MSSSEMQGAVLRITFVEMLFALAAGQVGIRAADLVAMDGSARLVGVSHLVLGLVVIAASWFGWQRSAVRSAKQEVERLFSVQFLGLLLDVGLVIIYFILVQEVDIKESPGKGNFISPSAYPEALWLLVVFLVYLIWDLVTDVLSPGSIPQKPKLTEKIRVVIGVGVACTICSGVCALLSMLVLFAAQETSSVVSVVLLDGALLAVVLLFRVLKPVLEPKAAIWLRVEDCTALKVRRPIDGTEGRWLVALVFIYGLALACASWRIFAGC